MGRINRNTTAIKKPESLSFTMKNMKKNPFPKPNFFVLFMARSFAFTIQKLFG